MSKWFLFLGIGYSIIIAVLSTPIQNENDTKKAAPVAESRARQQAVDASTSATASAVVAIASPAVAALPAQTPAESEYDDDEDEDDDGSVDLLDDDEKENDHEEEGGTTNDDDEEKDEEEEEDNDDYDLERILSDIFGDDDENEGEEEADTTSSEAIIAAAAAVTPFTTAPLLNIQGLAVSPGEVVGEGGDQSTTNEEDDQLANDNNNSHTVTLLTNSQPGEVDGIQEHSLNNNEIGAALNNAPPTPANTTASEVSDEEENDEEGDEDDGDVLGDNDEQKEEEEEEEDGDDEDEARKSKTTKADGAISVPASYIVKYNNYVDGIFSRINNILKKNYDPVNVRLQTAPPPKKKPSATKNTPKIKRKPVFNRPSRQTDESFDFRPLLSTKETGRLLNHTKSVQHTVRRSKGLQRRKTQNKVGTKNSTKSKVVRAKATLYGLSSLRRDGDVAVNVLSTYTAVRSKFLVGPLTLKVEKEFGRGARKELRSAMATTAEILGKLNLKVVHGGDASLSSIKVLQPKQLHIESHDQNDQTNEFLRKRSSSLARVVSQKLANAAKFLLPP